MTDRFITGTRTIPTHPFGTTRPTITDTHTGLVALFTIDTDVTTLTTRLNNQTDTPDLYTWVRRTQ